MTSSMLSAISFAIPVLWTPSHLFAEYALDVVEIFDRACIPYAVDDRHPSTVGLRNLTASERMSTIYEGEVFDGLIWVDPDFEFTAFYIVPNEGCGVSGWVSEPSAIVEEVQILANRLGAVPIKYKFREIPIIREQGVGVARFCMDIVDEAKAIFINARIGREGERWGATLSTFETDFCEAVQSGENS